MEGLEERVSGYGDVLMRVPLLFVVDELLRLLAAPKSIALNVTISGSPGNLVDLNVDGFSPSTDDPFALEHISLVDSFYDNYLAMPVKLAACSCGCAVALLVFLFSTKHLVVMYLYLATIGVVFVSYWSNVKTIKAITLFLSYRSSLPSILDEVLSFNFVPLMRYGPVLLVLQNYVLQCLLAFIFCYTHLAPRYPVVQTLLVLSFLTPSMLSIYPLPATVLHSAPVFATLLPLAVSKFSLWYNSVGMMMILKSGYKRAKNIIGRYGILTFAEAEWRRLNVPRVLRTFWILRVAEQVVQILRNHRGDEAFTYYAMMGTLLVNGCETLTALLGMTSVISYICHYIGCFMLWILMTEHVNGTYLGTVSAVIFYILALQNGLTSLDREKRLVRLYRNFCLLFAAVLNCIHNIVKPLLMSLSASHNPALHRHVRALGVCAILIILPVSLLVFLWSHFTISTWLLAVSVFSVEVIVKVFVSLAIYSLFLFDAYRSVFWEHLDDCVYMIQSFGNTVEFSFAIVLLFNGFWTLVFESGGAIRAIMMCAHTYLNIWREANAGWSVFMKRRTAVNKINSLPEAKAEQLRALDEVCAICYQEMRSAKVTRCNHYFHGVCLRKWLYIKDRCPLCHNILYKVQNNQAAPSSSENQEPTRNIPLSTSSSRIPSPTDETSSSAPR